MQSEYSASYELTDRCFLRSGDDSLAATTYKRSKCTYLHRGLANML